MFRMNIRKIIIILIIVILVSLSVFFATRRVNVVLIGTDNVEKNSYRADTIIFMSYKPFQKKLSMLSIPRDTMIESSNFNFAGTKDKIKINSLYMYGFSKGGSKKGCELIASVVSDLLQTRVPFYIHVDYDGFVKIIDLIGGVTVKVNKRMKYKDIAGKLDIDIMPGVQNFNGKKSLEYIRFRSDGYADIGRMGRQHEFIDSVIKKITGEYSIKQLINIIRIMFKYIDTNLMPNDILVFANKVKNIETMIDTLPGESIYVKGVSYWYPDHQKIQILVKGMLN